MYTFALVLTWFVVMLYAKINSWEAGYIYHKPISKVTLFCLFDLDSKIMWPLQLVAWPSGLRRWFKAPVSSEAWVRIPPLPSFYFDSSLKFMCIYSCNIILKTKGNVTKNELAIVPHSQARRRVGYMTYCTLL